MKIYASIFHSPVMRYLAVLSAFLRARPMLRAKPTLMVALKTARISRPRRLLQSHLLIYSGPWRLLLSPFLQSAHPPLLLRVMISLLQNVPTKAKPTLVALFRTFLHVACVVATKQKGKTQIYARLFHSPVMRYLAVLSAFLRARPMLRAKPTLMVALKTARISRPRRLLQSHLLIYSGPWRLLLSPFLQSAHPPLLLRVMISLLQNVPTQVKPTTIAFRRTFLYVAGVSSKETTILAPMKIYASFFHSSVMSYLAVLCASLRPRSILRAKPRLMVALKSARISRPRRLLQSHLLHLLISSGPWRPLLLPFFRSLHPYLLASRPWRLQFN